MIFAMFVCLLRVAQNLCDVTNQIRSMIYLLNIANVNVTSEFETTPNRQTKRPIAI